MIYGQGDRFVEQVVIFYPLLSILLRLLPTDTRKTRITCCQIAKFQSPQDYILTISVSVFTILLVFVVGIESAQNEEVQAFASGKINPMLMAESGLVGACLRDKARNECDH